MQESPRARASREGAAESSGASWTVAPSRNRRAAPRVAIQPGTPVRLTSQAGAQTARLSDASPWGLGLAEVRGPTPTVGGRVQVAFGLDRWAIRRAAEVRRCADGAVGLALADPLPFGLRTYLLDRRLPRLAPRRNATLSAEDALDRVWHGNDGAAVGQLHVARWSHGSWVTQQLTTRTMHPEAFACCRELFALAGTAALYGEGQDARLVAFYSPTALWDHRFCDGFVEWLDVPSAATSIRIDRRPLPTKAPGASTTSLRSPTVSALTSAVAELRAQWGPLVCAALGWTHEGLHSARLEKPLRRHVVEVHRERRHGLVIVDLPPARTLATEPLIWAFIAPGGNRTVVLDGARQAAQAVGIETGWVMSPPDPSLAATGAERVGVMVWSAAGLQQYDDYLGTMFDELGPLGR